MLGRGVEDEAKVLEKRVNGGGGLPCPRTVFVLLWELFLSLEGSRVHSVA